MKKAREFDNILDECLERVLIKGETIEQCLASYPEQAAELEPLLQTALAAKKASAIKPRPEFRERARYQFRAALQEMELERGRRFFFGWQPQWVTVVITVLVLLLASGGTVAAAGNSMPDEPLYGVKLATEAVRLTLTPSALGKAELYVKLADKRVAEIIKMADKGKAERVGRTVQRLDAHLVAMASLTVPGGEELVEEEAVTFEAPAPQAEVEEAPRAAVKEAPAAPPRPGKGARGGGEDKGKEKGVDKQVGLKMLMSRRAVENSQALLAVLERVPESVKPAVQEAVDVADRGYGRILRALD